MADHDDQDAAAAMAQMMGFSSFGNQNPSKKRKLSPGASSARQQNQHPPATSANAVEIGLRDEKDNTRNSSSHHEGAGVEGGASTEEATRPAHPAGLPARPPPQHQGQHQHQGQRFSRGGPARQNHRAPGGGSWHHGAGEGGDGTGYHDDLANTNPWEALETRMGLESRGAWLPRPARAGAATAAPEQQEQQQEKQEQQEQQVGDAKEQLTGTEQENEPEEEKEG